MAPNELPGKRCQLIVQVIGLEQADHRRRRGRSAATFLRCVDFIADVRTGRSAQALTSSVWPEEHPPVSCERRAEGFKRLRAQHARRASVVIEQDGKRSGAVRLIHHAVKSKRAAWKRDDIRRTENQRRKYQTDDHETQPVHRRGVYTRNIGVAMQRRLTATKGSIAIGPRNPVGRR
jgi:hypothetical protein